MTEYVLRTEAGEVVATLRDVTEAEAVDYALKEQWERGETLTLKAREERS